jgi:hypothetical protein
MKYKSCCPNCEKPQTRWEFLEPFPNFANQCKGCRTLYKSSKFSFYFGTLIGLAIVGVFISADKNLITWQVAFAITFIILAITAYASPYFTNLVGLKESERNIINKWMLPYLKWQFFIIAFAILLIFANAFTLVINQKSLNASCCMQDKIEKVESIEKIKLIIQSESKLFMTFSKLYKSLFELNVTISIGLFILLMFNVLFYFKIRDLHNTYPQKETIT